MAKVQLSPDQFQRIARAISDANRWEMLRVIFSRPDVNCGDVSGALPITAGTASHHLKELETAELVEVTPRRDVWQAYLAQLKEL
jgi:ArsR family transcriptional regulator